MVRIAGGCFGQFKRCVEFKAHKADPSRSREPDGAEQKAGVLVFSSVGNLVGRNGFAVEENAEVRKRIDLFWDEKFKRGNRRIFGIVFQCLNHFRRRMVKPDRQM